MIDLFEENLATLFCIIFGTEMDDVPECSFCSDLSVPGYDLFLECFYECFWVIFDDAADDFIFDSLGDDLLDGYVLEGKS